MKTRDYGSEEKGSAVRSFVQTVASQGMSLTLQAQVKHINSKF